ncbi:PEP-CTERM sorting domain-containing protein [Poriferisphaera sp. WC338]|uniref:PEP-CTERM sorting domain-containing protein n=1 Tax=Poriferisphaera sp. WC338 TaxID=3425129 RepID=UPI003D817565
MKNHTQIVSYLVVSLAVVLCCTVTSVANANISLNTTLDQETHQFSPAIPEFGISSISTAKISTASANIDTLVQDFSALGDTTLDYTITSSTGAFHVNFVEAGTLAIAIEQGGVFGGTESVNLATTLTFNGVTGGTAPANPTAHAAIRGLTDPSLSSFSVSSNLNFAAGTSFSFTSITFSVDFPASYDGNLPILPGNPILKFDGQIQNVPASLGQFVSLNPIPEPASLSLLTLGALALARRR